MRTVDELNAALDPMRVALRGLVRRVSLTLTGTVTAAKAIWQVSGVRMLNSKIEVFKAEAFTGIGFFARPPANGKPEVIVLNVSADNETPVIVAARDEATRQASAGGIKADETAAFNSQVIFYLKNDGTIEGRTIGGVAVSLAKASELQALAAHFYGHGHPSTGAGPIPTFVPPDPPGAPLVNPGQPGTTVLKGQ